MDWIAIVLVGLGATQDVAWVFRRVRVAGHGSTGS